MNYQQKIRDKITFLLHAILEQKLNHVPSAKELEQGMTLAAEATDDRGVNYIVKWKGDKMFSVEIKKSEDGNALTGEWDLPEGLINDEFVREKLNQW